MNIFVSFPDPELSAKYLDDKRVIKMILESAQLLSTAITVRGGDGPYKVTHKNHPCAIWCRETKANYDWLYEHFLALSQEYFDRYSKVHKCLSISSILREGRELMPNGELTPFPNCTIFKEESDVHLAYRTYLNHKWDVDKRKPTWHRGQANRPQ